MLTKKYLTKIVDMKIFTKDLEKNSDKKFWQEILTSNFDNKMLTKIFGDMEIGDSSTYLHQQDIHRTDVDFELCKCG